MLNIDALRLGIAGGILVGAGIFLLTLLGLVAGLGMPLLEHLQTLFPGYEISVLGSIIGAVYGFIAGFVDLFLLAFIYNLLGPTNNTKN